MRAKGISYRTDRERLRKMRALLEREWRELKVSSELLSDTPLQDSMLDKVLLFLIRRGLIDDGGW